MTATYGGLMGALFKMETRAGDQKQIGLQGFVPRPRFQSPGFGRIEGSFPRFYFGGRSGGARFRYFTAVEYNFERITVPDVTQGSGPNTVEQSGSVFGRFDIEVSPQHQLTIHALIFPSATDLQGLSVRRDELASPNIKALDMFVGSDQPPCVRQLDAADGSRRRACPTTRASTRTATGRRACPRPDGATTGSPG